MSFDHRPISYELGQPDVTKLFRVKIHYFSMENIRHSFFVYYQREFFTKLGLLEYLGTVSLNHLKPKSCFTQCFFTESIFLMIN